MSERRTADRMGTFAERLQCAVQFSRQHGVPNVYVAATDLAELLDALRVAASPDPTPESRS